MSTDIYTRLSEKSFNEVDELKNLGWEFRDAYWESGHNGDPYYDVEFKSPNMQKWASIDEGVWSKITKKYLLDREAHHAAHDWSNDIFHYTSVITNPMADGLKKHFLKTKNTNIGKLYSSNAEFNVKVSPMLKKAKKVKVTIEIL